VVAFLKGDFEVINFAVCWESLVSISTFNSENLLGYAQSAGNISFISLSLLINLKNCGKEAENSSSETTRETSFNFDEYRNVSGKNSDEISDD
jgi:hypothetical protein